MRWIKVLLDKWKRKTSHIRQAIDDRDHKYKIAGKTNTKSDLSEYFYEPRDQLNSEACVGFGVSAILEYRMRRLRGLEGFRISPSYIWHNAKKYHGWENENKGVWIRYGFKAAFEYGFVPENMMPFNNPLIATPDEGDKNFGTFTKGLFIDKNEEYAWMEAGGIRNCLSKGDAVIFGTYLNNSFFGNTTGKISMDDPGKNNPHCMVIVGHDDDKQEYKVLNSWGTYRFDKGYLYLPYEYVNKYAYDIGTWRTKT